LLLNGYTRGGEKKSLRKRGRPVRGKKRGGDHALFGRGRFLRYQKKTLMGEEMTIHQKRGLHHPSPKGPQPQDLGGTPRGRVSP